jgi:signal transduction histidine kinase
MQSLADSRCRRLLVRIQGLEKELAERTRALAVSEQELSAQSRICEEMRNTLQAQKMEAIGQLAGGVAHELNNQLAVIRGSVDLSKNIAPENSVLSKSFQRIILSTEKSASLIRHLMLFGRRHPQFKVRLDLNDQIRGLQSILERLAGDDVAICLDLAPDLWPVRADAVNIEQVIINVAGNAREAMPGGGVITIRTGNAVFDQTTAPPCGGHSGSFVCLTVSDTGTGIEEQHLDRIFEPFFTTKGVGEGPGLGLAVAYGIVDAHGGWIDVTSVTGAGSTFKIYLEVL